MVLPLYGIDIFVLNFPIICRGTAKNEWFYFVISNMFYLYVYFYGIILLIVIRYQTILVPKTDIIKAKVKNLKLCRQLIHFAQCIALHLTMS